MVHRRGENFIRFQILSFFIEALSFFLLFMDSFDFLTSSFLSFSTNIFLTDRIYMSKVIILSTVLTQTKPMNYSSPSCYSMK